MVESDPEDILDELGSSMGKKPRRSITVEGHLVHTTKGGALDSYNCTLPGAQSASSIK
jgi:hypothetical protein